VAVTRESALAEAEVLLAPERNSRKRKSGRGFGPRVHADTSTNAVAEEAEVEEAAAEAATGGEEAEEIEAAEAGEAEGVEDLVEREEVTEIEDARGPLSRWSRNRKRSSLPGRSSSAC
jgi:hypothetical protein